MGQEKTNDYSFANVCNILGNKRHYDKGKIPDDIKLFIELAACFFVAPAASTSIAAAAGTITLASVISNISKKGKVIDAAKRVFEILRKNCPSYTDKYNRMKEAYTILWVAAFFDAFEKTVPEDIFRKIELVASEKQLIASPILLDSGLEDENKNSNIKLPNMVYSIEKVCDQLLQKYQEMTIQLKSFITFLAFSDEANERQIRTLDTNLDNLPDQALNTFMDEYITLCSHFGEFAVFINLEKERERNFQIESYYEKLIDCIYTKSEMGFQKLEETMLSLSEIQREQKVKTVINRLKEKYKDCIGKPIVKKTSGDKLHYPSIEESFIPQHYKLLEYTSTDIHLENEEQWNKYDAQDDMTEFWARYLIDPANISRLTLILGDPGSGKSRLTQIVSATINSDAELVIRIPLRDHIDYIEKKKIQEMICKQVEEDGDPAEKIDRLRWLTGDNPSRPITIIFDGYDEIQQATGLSYSFFLTMLSDFQETCQEDKRPVRIVVTSRRTLIDKAAIPIGSMVMKLLPFEKQQKEQWISIWNRNNLSTFRNAKLDKFQLPDDNEDVQDLSKLPLLLLMLAIYDADFDNKRNALREVITQIGKDFNRSRLYSELIQRFIARELTRVNIYGHVNTQLIEAEIEKLGIASLGMFVRERQWITVSELNNDFKKLGVKTKINESEEALESEEVFLGSFFFIHNPKIEENGTKSTKSKEKKKDRNASYVFLHKTFYEFLVADYILGIVLNRAIALAKEKHKSDYEKALSSIEQPIYLSLNSSSLCAEPEITTMISEWWHQKAAMLLDKYNEDVDEDIDEDVDMQDLNLLPIIEDMINNHTENLRKGFLSLPEEQSLLKSDHSISQRNALYILNMITLMVLMNKKWETNLEKWQFLAQYIKLFSPFPKGNIESSITKQMGLDLLDSSEELPLRFMTLFQIECNEKNIIIKRQDKLKIPIWDPIEVRIEILRFLQDHISEKIYSLHSPLLWTSKKIEHINELGQYSNSIRFEQLTANFAKAIRCHILSTKEFVSILSQFAEFIETIHVSIQSFIIPWINSFREVDKQIIADCSDTNMELLKRITAQLFSLYEKGNDLEWEYIFITWLNTCINKMNHAQAHFIIQSLITHLIDLNKISGPVLFEITKNIESISLDYKEKDIICEAAARCIREFDIVRVTQHVNTYHFAQEVIIKNKGPKWYACVIRLLRIEGSLQKIPTNPIKQFSSIKDDDEIWYELPYLLWEYVLSEQLDEVRAVIHNITLNTERLQSQAIHEYLSIAESIGETDFILTVYNMIRPDFGYNEQNMILFMHVANLLLLHDTSYIEELCHIFFISNHYYQAFGANPATLTKLLVQLYLLSKENAFDEIATSSFQKAVLLVYQNIDSLFQRSSQVALAFLRTIVLDPQNNIFMESDVKLTIRKLLPHANMTGQTEMIMQLESLL